MRRDPSTPITLTAAILRDRQMGYKRRYYFPCPMPDPPPPVYGQPIRQIKVTWPEPKPESPTPVAIVAR